MKYSWEKLWNAQNQISDGCKVPRKLKKVLVGKRVTKTKLRQLLSSVKITKMKYPESAKIEPYPFCPYCGCSGVYSVNHGAPWPEVWETEHCLRCHKMVGEADNSPFYHVLEYIMEKRQASARK